MRKNDWSNLESHFRTLLVAMEDLDADRLMTLLEESTTDVINRQAICGIGSPIVNDIVDRDAERLINSIDDEDQKKGEI